MSTISAGPKFPQKTLARMTTQNPKRPLDKAQRWLQRNPEDRHHPRWCCASPYERKCGESRRAESEGLKPPGSFELPSVPGKARPGTFDGHRIGDYGKRCRAWTSMR